MESGSESIHGVDPLAAVGTFAEKILVDVGDRKGIGVQPAWTGEDALEKRPLTASWQRWGDARLQHRVALDHAAAIRIQPRPVERMRHLPDQAPDGPSRQARIGIQSDHVADRGRYDG